MLRNKRLLVVMALIAGLLLLVIVLITRDNNKPFEPIGTGTVTFQNTAGLREILLAGQYSMVLDNMVSFIQDKVGKDTSEANIDSLAVQDDNSIKLTVSVPEANKKIVFIIQRVPRTPGDLVFQAPGYNYSKDLKPY